jgi:serine phosphatase RsbU (regulator of sigma subunit)
MLSDDKASGSRMGIPMAIPARNGIEGGRSEFLSRPRFKPARSFVEEFWRAALPAELPTGNAASVEICYSAREDLVGGDWYDVFEVGDGRLALSVGDVSGSGAAAAVTMATLRNVIRALTIATLDLPELMRYADSFLRSYAPHQFATTFFALYDPRTRELESVLCGHPRPFLGVPPFALVELSGEVFPPLGYLDFVSSVTVATQTIPNGALLFCYTDGLVEGRHDGLDGFELLRADLASGNVATNPRELVQRLFGREAPSDDAIAMMVRFADAG